MDANTVREKTEAKHASITLGENTCSLIKSIYFTEIPWGDCYRLVGAKFTELKKIMRKLSPNMPEIDLLKIINTFTSEDIRETFDDNSQ